MGKDDVTHVADLRPHLGLAGLGAQRGERLRLRPPIVGVVLAAQLRPRQRLVELVGEGVEGLLLVVGLHLVGPERLLVPHRVEQPAVYARRSCWTCDHFKVQLHEIFLDLFFKSNIPIGGLTVKSGIFDGFLEVFWIFLKNEHDKPLGTPNRAF